MLDDDKMKAPLQFVPEPLGVLQACYPAAVRAVCDAAGAALAPHRRPARKRQHVFDSEDGLRLIISRERMPDGHVGIHMSASISGFGTAVRQLENARRRGEDVGARFCAMAEHRWDDLARRPIRAEMLGWSTGHVPHWFERSEES